MAVKGFGGLIHNMVKLADTVSKDLQASITHAAYKGQNRSAEAEHYEGVTRQAIIEKKQELKRTATGQEKLSHTKIVILQSVSIDLRDKFTLPDGSVYPILAMNALQDSDGKPHMVEVWF